MTGEQHLQIHGLKDEELFLSIFKLADNERSLLCSRSKSCVKPFNAFTLMSDIPALAWQNILQLV